MASMVSDVPKVGFARAKAATVDVVANAAALHAFIEEEMARNSEASQLPLSVVEPMREAGLFWTLLTTSLGGSDTGLVPYMTMSEELSSAHPSVGWTVAAQSIGVLVAGNYTSDAHADMIFGGKRLPVVTAVSAPVGKMHRDSGGYIGSGRFTFGTGITHADWVSSVFVLQDNGQPARMEDGRPIWIAAILPADRMEIRGNWDVAGLKATGSYDYELRDAAIPEGMTMNAYWTEPTRASMTADINVLIPVCACHAAVILGIARKSLYEAARTATAKKRIYAAVSIADTPSFQYDFVRADAKYQAVRARCYEVFGEVDRKVRAGETISESEYQIIRQVTTWTHQVCREVIVSCYGLVSSSLRLPSILARNLADGAVAVQHYIVNDMSMIDAAPSVIDRWADETSRHSRAAA